MKNKKSAIFIFTIAIVLIVLHGVYRYNIMGLLGAKINPEGKKLEVWIYMNDNDSGYYFKIQNNCILESNKIFVDREYKPGDDEFIDIVRDCESVMLSKNNFEKLVDLANIMKTSIESVEKRDIASTYYGGLVVAVKYEGKYYDISGYTDEDWSKGNDENRQMLLKEFYDLLFENSAVKLTSEDIDMGFYVPAE